MHNEGLDYVIPILEKMQNPTIEDVKNVSLKYMYSVEDLLKEKGWEPPYEWKVDDFYLNFVFNSDTSDIYLNSIYKLYVNIVDSRYNKGVASEEFVDYSNDVFRLAEVEDINGLDNLSEEIYKSNLSDIEIGTLLSGISVAQYSMSYWNNLSKKSLLSLGTYILLVDLTGAVIGGIGGWTGGNWEDWWDAAHDILLGAVGFSAGAVIGTFYHQ